MAETKRFMFQLQDRMWQRIVRNLADELATPLSIVERMLGDEVAELDRVARIKEFVPLLASKRVKERVKLGPRPA